MVPQTRQFHTLCVHYGSGETTRRTVNALMAATPSPDTVTIIDQAIEPLQPPIHPTVTSIRPQENRGYGGGLTMGLGTLMARNISSDDLVLCMNNDLTIAPDTISALGRWGAQHTGDYLVGYRHGVVDRLTGRAHLQPAPRSLHQLSHPLSYLHGAFLAGPWGTFVQLQKIPDEYFMYWEDVALSWRARQQGVDLWVIPELGIHHDDTPPATLSKSHQYYLVRNGARFMERETTGLLRSWWWVYNRARYVYHRLRKTPIVAAALYDAIRGVTGPTSHTTDNKQLPTDG